MLVPGPLFGSHRSRPNFAGSCGSHSADLDNHQL